MGLFYLEYLHFGRNVKGKKCLFKKKKKKIMMANEKRYQFASILNHELDYTSLMSRNKVILNTACCLIVGLVITFVYLFWSAGQVDNKKPTPKSCWHLVGWPQSQMSAHPEWDLGGDRATYGGWLAGRTLAFLKLTFLQKSRMMMRTL